MDHNAPQFDFSASKNEPGKADSTTGSFVSLYLIILAFFVVMNFISNQVQSKVDAATESVTRAFNNPYEPEAVFVDVTASEDALTPNDEFYDQIQGVFASLVGFDKKFPTLGGHVIKITLDQDLLFRKRTAFLRDDQTEFVKQLSRFLATVRESEKREVEFIVYTGKKLPKGPEYWKDLYILRAGMLVRTLENLGVSGNQLSTGVVEGNADLFQISFFTRERVSARQSLTKNDLTQSMSDIAPAAGDKGGDDEI